MNTRLTEIPNSKVYKGIQIVAQLKDHFYPKDKFELCLLIFFLFRPVSVRTHSIIWFPELRLRSGLVIIDQG